MRLTGYAGEDGVLTVGGKDVDFHFAFEVSAGGGVQEVTGGEDIFRTLGDRARGGLRGLGADHRIVADSLLENGRFFFGNRMQGGEILQFDGLARDEATSFQELVDLGGRCIDAC